MSNLSLELLSLIAFLFILILDQTHSDDADYKESGQHYLPEMEHLHPGLSRLSSTLLRPDLICSGDVGSDSVRGVPPELKEREMRFRW